tara:strand:+ start:7146 stop:7292 length:147 start_codon:yes stop_codon:yes gene_type:complete
MRSSGGAFWDKLMKAEMDQKEDTDWKQAKMDDCHFQRARPDARRCNPG